MVIMVTFSEARRVVEEKYSSPTLRDGFEDSQDFNILLQPPLDDQVVLVTKDSGETHFEVYFEVQDKLEAMVPVTDPERE